MRKLLFLILITALIPVSLLAQRQMENLGRGLNAVKVENGVYVNWRITAQEWQGVSYNLYRDGILVNNSPLTGASNYTDMNGTLASTYQVAAVINGIEQGKSSVAAVNANPYLQINLREIPKIPGVPDSYYEMYTINDAAVADLDGDGEYEIIFKRVNLGYNPEAPEENKYYTLIEAYKLDGTYLWTIDLGPNVYNDVEIDILAFDFNGDGKAEVVLRTSEGTVDGLGNVIPDVGDTEGNMIPDGKTNYRDGFKLNNSWYEFTGPELISIFDGATGKELDRAPMIARAPASQWGLTGHNDSQLAHRALKFMWGAPYLDGKKPSIFIGRGIYERIKWTAFDAVIENGETKLKQRWDVIDLGSEYYQQGNHNFSIADVDNDGCDEILYGQMTINNDGTGLYSTRLGHGDAIHVGNFDPYRKGLEVMSCLENAPYAGTTFRAAEDGKILLQWIRGTDQGRCMAANITNDYPGAQAWPPSGNSQKVWAVSLGEEVDIPQGSSNFRIYWDGDLLDELVDHTWDGNLGKGTGLITKYQNGTWFPLLDVDYYSCNYTKGTPVIQADILGDWREEIVWRSPDDSNVRIYFTTIPTEHRIYTLMHDHQYRQAVAWQNVGYNQPPHVSYFVGETEGILLPPPPVSTNGKLIFTSGTTWDKTTSAWTKDGVSVVYSDGEEVLFDYSITNAITNITIAQTVAPANVTVNSRYNYRFTPASGAKLTGDMKLIKQGEGTLILDGEHNYNGSTEIWDGTLQLSGSLVSSPVWMNLFGELDSDGSVLQGVTMNYGSVLYPGLKNKVGSMTIGNALVLKDNAIICFDLSETTTDQLLVNGDITLGSDVQFTINSIGSAINEGNYALVSFTGQLNGDVSAIKAKGPDGYRVEVALQGSDIVLTVTKLRDPASLVWQGALNNGAWDFDTANFLLSGSPATFVKGDAVTFSDASSVRTVTLQEDVEPSNVIVNTTGEYMITGNRRTLSGNGSVTVEKGTLQLPTTNDYTGATYVNEGGILKVSTLPTSASNGSIGVASEDPDLFVINGGVLINTEGGVAQNAARALRIGDKGATVRLNTDVTWDALVTGGKLIKEGPATMALLGTATSDYTAVDHTETTIREGTLWLRSEFVKPGNKVTFEGGTLQCFDDNGSYSSAYWDAVVAAGQTGVMNLDGRCNYYGSLTGAGELTVYSPFSRSILMGDWSAFAGKLNITSGGRYAGYFTYTDAKGLPNADVNFLGASESITLTVSDVNVTGGFFKGSTYALGALSGNEFAILDGAWTWEVGARNLNTTFDGIIRNSGSLNKTGTGSLTLTNANTYTGTTTVSGGILIAANTTGSATGTGLVTVNAGGTLAGNGYIAGTTTVATNGTLKGSINFSGDLALATNAILQINVTYTPGNIQYDTVTVGGTINVNGSKLIVSATEGSSAIPAGVEIKVVSGNISGTFSSTELPATASGASWDTSALYTSGIIRTVAN